MKKILKGGILIEPTSKKSEKLDILIEKDIITFVGPNIEVSNAEVIDISDAIVTPGLIDMHVHLREPGREDKETIETGTKAAVAGGFTTIACMPNTQPVNDNQAVTQFIINKAEKANNARVHPIGSISKNLEGKELSEIGELVANGVVAISDDGRPVMNSELFRRALEYSKMFNIPVIDHAEDETLVGNGVINEGFYSTLLGLPAQPAIAEEIMIERDVKLAEYTGGHVHIAHISSRKSLEIIRRAKAEGVNVTCEVTTHHLTLSDDLLQSFDTNYKMAPPLRTKDDVDALIEGLKDGTIDAIVSDHAPHTIQDKELEFIYAPFGIIGLETSLPVLITKLVNGGKISLQQLIEKFTDGPAKVLNLPIPSLKPKSVADITVIAPAFEFTIDSSKFFSKSRNTPYNGFKANSCAVMTFVAGELKYRNPLWHI